MADEYFRKGVAGVALWVFLGAGLEALFGGAWVFVLALLVLAVGWAFWPRG